MNAVIYHGSAEAREIIRDREFRCFEGKVNPFPFFSLAIYEFVQETTEKGLYRFNVLITTYEMVLTDVELLAKIQWKVLVSANRIFPVKRLCLLFQVIDEAHRLKNSNSRLSEELRKFKYDHCVMLTGLSQFSAMSAHDYS